MLSILGKGDEKGIVHLTN